MAQATKIDGKWHMLVPGETVRHDDTVASYETAMGWSQEERDVFGVYTVAEPDPVPPGKVVISTSVGDKNGKPAWIVVLGDAPTPSVADVIASVEAEKTRRIEAGFPFKGKVIQSRAEDRENIAGARSAAQDAKVMGADVGDFGWQRLIDPVSGAPMFAWITADNTLLPLDADDMIAMGYAAMFHKQRMIFDAKAIKDRIASGENVGDVTRDELWPV